MTELHHIEKHASGQAKYSDNNNGFAGTLDKMISGKDKAIKGFINNKGLFVGIILVCIVILVFTTNVNFASAAEVVKLSLVVFVLMFCSYTMYVNCADSGTKAGKATVLYIETQEKYEKVKKRIIDGQHQMELGAFCRWYVDEELKNSRKDILDSVGVDYEDYLKKWVGADKNKVLNDKELSEREKTAILEANRLAPIKLTPEMILKRERGNKHRVPLGSNPVTKRKVKYGIKLFTTISTSLFTCMLALDIISDPSWATFAELCIKLLMVILSGFSGYKMGYENITVDTVNYVSDQTDLLHQFEQYLLHKAKRSEGQTNE